MHNVDMLYFMCTYLLTCLRTTETGYDEWNMLEGLANGYFPNATELASPYGFDCSTMYPNP